MPTPITILDILHAAREMKRAGIAARDLTPAIRGALALLYGTPTSAPPQP